MKSCIKKPFTVPPCEVVLEANEDDIRRYVSRKLEMDDNFADMKNSGLFKKEIMDKIIETANGMFLLPALQIETVLEQTSISKRRAALDSMPKKLEDAFQVTIGRIKSQASGKSSQGMEVLKWTYLAKRPLSVMELRHALATVHSTAECFDQDDLPFEKSLTECCYGLVVIDKETSSVRLVHKSLQDFLKDQYENAKLFETGHRDIAFTCLKYLSFSDDSMFGNPVCDVNTVKILIYLRPNYDPHLDHFDTPSARIDRFPLLIYAIYFGGYHARGNIDQEIEELAIKLLILNQEKPHSISHNLDSVPWYDRVMMSRIISSRNKRSFQAPPCSVDKILSEEFVSSSTEFAGMHIIAYFRLDEIYEALIKKLDNFDVNRKIFGMTSLLLAVKKGHYAVVRQLIAAEVIDIELKDVYGKTPLFYAANEGHEAVALLLLEEGAQIDSKDESGMTPLFFAVIEGKKTVIRLLLDKGAQIDSKDDHGSTPLFYAASTGQEDFVRLLLENGAQVDWKDKKGQTPLFAAVDGGRKDVVSLLLEKGAQVDWKDEKGQTPLFDAAQSGNEDVVRLLLEKGAQVDSKDEEEKTPLFYAAQTGEEYVVRLLLEKEAQVDPKARDGKTPLFYAAQDGQEDVVRLLLEKGACTNSRDNRGRTPLLHAVGKFVVNCVEPAILVLLEEGAEVNVRDKEGWSVLLIVQERIASIDCNHRLLERMEHILKQRGAVL